ncbi:uncharacterized protein [Procambarus clarkii]|uniref:uncharacterized protein n=1 Tax=Procambarus clarkii TaxID=6728 RepID=UPI0037442B58
MTAVVAGFGRVPIIVVATDTRARPHDPADTRAQPHDPAGTRARPDDPAGTRARPDDPAGTRARPHDPAGTRARPDDPAGTRARPHDPAGTRARPDDPADTRAQPHDPAGTRARPHDPAGTRARPHDPAGTRARLHDSAHHPRSASPAQLHLRDNSQENVIQEEKFPRYQGVLLDEGVPNAGDPSLSRSRPVFKEIASAPSSLSPNTSLGCQLDDHGERHYAGRISRRQLRNSRVPTEKDLSSESKHLVDHKQDSPYTFESKNDSETVLENIERMVISIVKRDTMRLNSEGERVGHRELYTQTVLRDSLKTRRIRHRRHKVAQQEWKSAKHVDTLSDLFSSPPQVPLDNMRHTDIINDENSWEEHDAITDEDYDTNSLHLYSPGHSRGWRLYGPVPAPTHPPAYTNKQVLNNFGKVIHTVERRSRKTPNTLTFPAPGNSEDGEHAFKFLRRKNIKPKQHFGKHVLNETYIRKMNFKGYQVTTEDDNDAYVTDESSLIIRADGNNISNELSGAMESDLSNYVEEPLGLPTGPTHELVEASSLPELVEASSLPELVEASSSSELSKDSSSPKPVESSTLLEQVKASSSPELVGALQPLPLTPTTSHSGFPSTSSSRHLPVTKTSPNSGDPTVPVTPAWKDNTDDSVNSSQKNYTTTITIEKDSPEKSKACEAERINDTADTEASVPPSNAKNDTSKMSLTPAFIPAKLPFGPFLSNLGNTVNQEAPPVSLMEVVKKFKPFIIPDDQKERRKPNSGDLMTNVLSPIFGGQQQSSKARNQKVLEFDNARSHNEELYNQVSGPFMPGFGSKTTGYPSETYPSLPFARREKHRMFTNNKLHGGFFFIDKKHEQESRPIIPPPVVKDSPREQNLVIFGHVADNGIMDTIRNCSRHITLQLTDHYSMADLARESSNPMRQLIVYFNLKSVNYESYFIALERTKRILDHLIMHQGGVTMFTVIPTQEEKINTTASKEVKAQLLNLNDAILDYCAQDYPSCYITYNLASIAHNLQQTYNKNSGFNVYDRGGRRKEACIFNEVCGTAKPTTAATNTGAMLPPEQQLRDLADAICLSSYHIIVELVSDAPSYDFDDFTWTVDAKRGESMRVRAQTGLVLHDILPRDLKKYDKNRPPKYEGHATIVYFHVTVLSVDSINEESMTYVADIFLAQSWRDHRLRLPENMTEEYRILDVEWLHNIWRPDCFFKNAKRVTFHEMSVPNHYLWLYHDKTLLYMAKLTLVLSCAMKFEAYPHDTQICSMMIESLSHTTHDLVFKWNETDPLVVNPDIELPQLDISRNNTEDCTLTYSTGNFTCLAVVFNLRRRLGYHLFHTYVPSAITVVMSWISFWIKPEAIPARVTLGVTSLLTLATQNQQSQSSLPPVSYIKAIDVWMSSCTVFVFASLLQFGIVNYFMETEPLSKDMTGYSVEDLTDIDEKKSEDGHLNGYSRSRSRNRSRLRAQSPGVPQYVVHRCSGKDIAIYIDKFSRLFFPFAFFVLNVSYWTTYGTM